MTAALVRRSPTDLALIGPIGSFDAYAEAVSRIPVLSREDEVELAERFRRDNDLDAARQLVLSHLRFVVHIDPAVGVRLVSFAVHWIRAEIHEYVLRNWRLVKVATTKAQRKLFFNLRKYKRSLGWLTADETRAVARDLGVSPDEVTEMERRLSSRDLSYDPAPDADEEEGSYSPSAYLPAPDADPAVAVERAEWDDDVTDRVAQAMTQLDARSQAVLRARWMGENKATLHELALEYGVSAERIRQIEANAIKKLRKLVVAEDA